MIFVIFLLFIFEISKEEKSKTIIARRKTRTGLEFALNYAQIYDALIQISVLFF